MGTAEAQQLRSVPTDARPSQARWAAGVRPRAVGVMGCSSEAEMVVPVATEVVALTENYMFSVGGRFVLLLLFPLDPLLRVPNLRRFLLAVSQSPAIYLSVILLLYLLPRLPDLLLFLLALLLSLVFLSAVLVLSPDAVAMISLSLMMISHCEYYCCQCQY